MIELLEDLKAAGAAGDATRVQAIASQALSSLAPSGALADVAQRAEASRKLDELLAEHAADQSHLKYLDEPRLIDVLEDGFAVAVPTLTAAATPLENWAIPLLSSLAGPFAPLLSFGLLVACKVALAALQAWADKRRKAMA